MDLDGFKGMSPGNELDKCIGDLRKKVTEDPRENLLVGLVSVISPGVLRGFRLNRFCPKIVCSG